MLNLSDTFGSHLLKVRAALTARRGARERVGTHAQRCRPQRCRQRCSLEALDWRRALRCTQSAPNGPNIMPAGPPQWHSASFREGFLDGGLRHGEGRSTLAAVHRDEHKEDKARARLAWTSFATSWEAMPSQLMCGWSRTTCSHQRFAPRIDFHTAGQRTCGCDACGSGKGSWKRNCQFVCLRGSARIFQNLGSLLVRANWAPGLHARSVRSHCSPECQPTCRHWSLRMAAPHRPAGASRCAAEVCQC